MQMLLSQVASAVDGLVLHADTSFKSISTDSRTLKEGDLFVALQGPNFDGHDHIEAAIAAGAGCAMVSRELPMDFPQLLVDDTHDALGHMARYWRQQANPTIVGITGSNGKTTLKEMVAAILAKQATVLFTHGNLNNDIGVPLTLMRLQDEMFAVVEMGANHPHEIDYLTNIVQPNIAVLNNAGLAHIEGFKTLEGVATSKAEIINGIVAGGLFIYNGDDQFASLWADLSKDIQTRTFGLSAMADVRSDLDAYEVDWTENGFEVNFPVFSAKGDFQMRLALGGEHNRMNALAATAVAQSFNVPNEVIVEALAEMKPVVGRLHPVQGFNQMRLVDDSYNANPDSVIAAVKVLKAAPGKRTFVLGDLGELGEDAYHLHQTLGEFIKSEKIDRLLTVGKLSQAASEAFGEGAKHFEDQQALVDELKKTASADDSVLVKGSRASQMDKVVQALSVKAESC